MKVTPLQIKSRFSQELVRCCIDRYKEMPSNERLARDLHIASKYRMKVSRETVRKWIKAESFPDLEHLMHLIEWLKLDMAQVFLSNSLVLEVGGEAETLTKGLGELNAMLSSVQLDDLLVLLAAIKESGLMQVTQVGKS